MVERPPSKCSIWSVIQFDSSDSKYLAVSAIFLGLPILLRGGLSSERFLCFSFRGRFFSQRCIYNGRSNSIETNIGSIFSRHGPYKYFYSILCRRNGSMKRELLLNCYFRKHHNQSSNWLLQVLFVLFDRSYRSKKVDFEIIFKIFFPYLKDWDFGIVKRRPARWYHSNKAEKFIPFAR